MSIPGIKVESGSQLPQDDLKKLLAQTMYSGTICLNALLQDPALSEDSKLAIFDYIKKLDECIAQLNPERSVTSSQEEPGLDMSEFV